MFKRKSILKIIFPLLVCFFIAEQLEAQQNRHRNRRGGRGPGNRDNSSALKIVTSFSDFATIAQEIAGDNANVFSIAHGIDDPHFVPPKPSLALKLKKADMPTIQRSPMLLPMRTSKIYSGS